MLTSAVITGLTAGWVAAGAAAAAVPVIIHLWTARRPRVFLFPAARFVRSAAAGWRRRRRLRDAALLSLRCAAVLAIASAFAGPEWTPPVAAGGAPAEGMSLTVVLDASASMRRTAGGVALFDVAKARARRMLERLDPARDRAAVILLDASPRPVLPALSANIPALLDALDEASCTLERGEAAEAMRLAEATIGEDETRTSRRCVVVLSDMQATQWRGVRIDDRAAIHVEPLRPDQPDGNLALADLAVSPARPVAGRPTRLTVLARNMSALARSAVVAFRADGRTLAEVDVELPPWSERGVSTDAVFESVGFSAVEADLTDTGFTADDTARAGVEVVAAPRVAFIAESGDESALYVRAAVEASLAAPPETIPLAAAGDMDEFDCAAVVGAAEMDDDGIDALARLARRGGTVLWVIDSPESAASAERFAARAGAFPFARMTRDDAGGGGVVRLAAGGVARRPGDEVFRAAEGLRVVLPIRPTPADGAEVLLGSEAGAVVARCAVGGGFAAAMAADLASPASDLARSPVFPAIVHLLMDHGRESGRGGAAVFVGEEIPGVKERTTEPGFVGGRRIGVNVHPDESDGRPLRHDEIRAIVRPAGGGASGIALSASDPTPRRVELWPYLAASAMVFLACEALLRQHSGRRRAAA